MAKKLNKKVVIIGIVLLAMMACALVGGLVYLKIHRDPDRALEKARQALAAQDYKTAQEQFGRSYSFGKDNTYRVERLFDLAELYLIQNSQHEAEWNKAMGCWDKITSIDTNNIEARRKLMDFYYQAADAGDPRLWKNVHENTTKLMDILKKQGTEPDSSLLLSHAKALLSIAQRGETTNRSEPLNECVAVLEQLIEKEPGNQELYRLMAEASAVQGELDAQAGVIKAVENARQKAAEWLQKGVDLSEDKATATANLILYQLQSSMNDPNAIEKVRADIETHRAQIQPNDVFWQVASMAYELPGKRSAEAELNQAIETIRQAHELKPDNFEYTLRLARLMYRKGNAFADPAALADGMQIAEAALSLEAVQDIPGPLQGRNLNYRFALNTFLADLYLEKALAAKREGKTSEAEEWTGKAEPRIAVISGILSAADNPTLQKYQGLLAVAKDQKEKGQKLLYNAYEQNRALDKPQEFSNTDPLVCMVLADMAKQDNEPGMRREFLQWAIYNNSRFVLQKPQLILEYAEVLGQLRSWAYVERLIEEYQTRYGANEQSRMLSVQAAIGLKKYGQARKLLTSMDAASSTTFYLRLDMLNGQIAQAAAAIAEARQAQPPQEPSAEQLKTVETLRSERNTVLDQMFKTDVKQIDSYLIRVICVDLLQSKQTAKAIGYLDAYLAARPDAFSLQVLRLQAAQDDPLNLTAEQRAQLQEKVFGQIQDPKQKALLLAGHYRLQGDHEKAMSSLTGDSSLDTDNDPELLNMQFEIVLEQNDVPRAEALLQKVRAKNTDGCGGLLASAKVKILKKEYLQAQRDLDECLKERPLYSYLHYLKSQVQQQQQENEAAISSARTAVRMNPLNPAFVRNLASLLFTRNNQLGTKAT
ncbi:MAG: hypothetical protein L0Y36_05010, partial [Planctomycetales bacterium]|nr:hypothetical protein [Planctomycetales bacterium]